MLVVVGAGGKAGYGSQAQVRRLKHVVDRTIREIPGSINNTTMLPYGSFTPVNSHLYIHGHMYMQRVQTRHTYVYANRAFHYHP